MDSAIRIPIGELSIAGSPRTSGANLEHVQALAAAHVQLPPIIVHRATMRVIDGVHRLQAAKLRGQERIAVRFFSGSEADAFVLAVQLNIAHGLPLSLADREAAAARVITSHPQWSDRMIASVTGISAKTVSEVRKRQVMKSADVASRIGQDGRVRPINGSVGRVLASELMTANPGLSLRQVARATGISPETARDVRNRLGRGEDPVPRRGKKLIDAGGPLASPPSAGGTRMGINRASSVSPAAVVERLRADPALRLTETGRTLLRLLHVHLVEADAWERIGANVPPHCSSIIADLARQCAQLWTELADQVERKMTSIT